MNKEIFKKKYILNIILIELIGTIAVIEMIIHSLFKENFQIVLISGIVFFVCAITGYIVLYREENRLIRREKELREEQYNHM